MFQDAGIIQSFIELLNGSSIHFGVCFILASCSWQDG